jgi:hypothetical protein
MQTKAVRTNSSFYMYKFESEKSRSSSAHWIQGALDSRIVVRTAVRPIKEFFRTPLVVIESSSNVLMLV